MGQQPRHVRRLQRRRVAAMPLGGLAGVVVEQQGNVLTPRAQRRHFDFRHVQAVEQVLAEAAGAHLVVQVRLGGADHPHVDADAAVGTQALQALLLDHPQQLDLLGQRHALDLVEEQAAAVGVLDAPDALALRAGEGTALVAEQLALEDALRNRRAVEGDELAPGARAEVVQAARHQFLAAAGLAADQHVDRRAGQLQHLLTQLHHGRRSPQQQAVQLPLARHLGAQLAVFHDQPAGIQGAAHAVQQALGTERLLDEVVGAALHGLHRHVHIAVAGDQDQRQLAVDVRQAFEQLQAITAGHAHVADQHAGEVAAEQRQRLGDPGADAHADAGQLQPLAHRLADGRLIVDKQHFGAHARCLSFMPASSTAGKRRVKMAPCAPLAACRLPPRSRRMP